MKQSRQARCVEREYGGTLPGDLSEIPTGRLSREKEPPLHVLLCPDQPGWAFDNIADTISRHANGNRVSKLYMRDTIGKEYLFFRAILLKRIDLCHVFWREDLFYLLHPTTIRRAAGDLGLDFETLARGISRCAFTTSVYDHLFTDPDEMRKRRARFACIDGYTVSSRRLLAAYSADPDLPAPDIVITDGVDLERFSPAPGPAERPVPTVGWVGNSAWGRASRKEDVKGYHRLFVPMMAELAARGIRAEPNVADPQQRRVPFEEMPDFYRATDVFVCTSLMEGTPNPVLEAMACGVPVVSTDVGVVPEAFGELQRRFIIADPTAAAFADAVAELLASPALREALGAENRSRMRDWSWEIKTKDWWPFWRRVVRGSTDLRASIRRELSLHMVDA